MNRFKIVYVFGEEKKIIDWNDEPPVSITASRFITVNDKTLFLVITESKKLFFCILNKITKWLDKTLIASNADSAMIIGQNVIVVSKKNLTIRTVLDPNKINISYEFDQEIYKIAHVDGLITVILRGMQTKRVSMEKHEIKDDQKAVISTLDNAIKNHCKEPLVIVKTVGDMGLYHHQIGDFIYDSKYMYVLSTNRKRIDLLHLGKQINIKTIYTSDNYMLDFDVSITSFNILEIFAFVADKINALPATIENSKNYDVPYQIEYNYFIDSLLTYRTAFSANFVPMFIKILKNRKCVQLEYILDQFYFLGVVNHFDEISENALLDVLRLMEKRQKRAVCILSVRESRRAEFLKIKENLPLDPPFFSTFKIVWEKTSNKINTFDESTIDEFLICLVKLIPYVPTCNPIDVISLFIDRKLYMNSFKCMNIIVEYLRKTIDRYQEHEKSNILYRLWHIYKWLSNQPDQKCIFLRQNIRDATIKAYSANPDFYTNIIKSFYEAEIANDLKQMIEKLQYNSPESIVSKIDDFIYERMPLRLSQESKESIQVLAGSLFNSSNRLSMTIMQKSFFESAFQKKIFTDMRDIETKL